MIRLCSICARGGSKGVKNKNIRNLLGKPLITHSILQAKASGLFAAVAVSSDSQAILDVAKEWGADYLIVRPPEMATDEAPKLPVIQHCFIEVEKLSGMKYDVLVDLDTSAPLRNIEDIQKTVAILEERKISNVITGAPARKSPYFNLVEVDAKGVVRLSKPPAQSIACRQDSPPCYDLNASIYVWRRHALLNSRSVFNEDTHLYVMPRDRSVDIDSEIDFEFAEYLGKRRPEFASK